MPSYESHSEDDRPQTRATRQSWSLSKYGPRPTPAGRSSKEFPYLVQRTLSEPHRLVVAAAINAALAENPVRGFRPRLDEMPVTLLTARDSDLIFSSTGGLQTQSDDPLQSFNDRLEDFVNRTNQVRPTVAAEAQRLSTFKLDDARHKRFNHMAVVHLIGEGAQTIMCEVDELHEDLRDPKPLAFRSVLDLGFSTSRPATDRFVAAMSQAWLAPKITAALRSEANPEGLLEFGPLEAK